MAGFEQHRQDFAPQVGCFHALVQLEFAVAGHLFVLVVALFKSLAVEVVQIGHIVGREQRPLAVFKHTLHEQVGNPVRGVHVVGTAAIVTGVLAQLEEFLDVHVPGFEVGTDRAFALAALVNGHGGVVDHFQEGHHAL